MLRHVLVVPAAAASVLVPTLTGSPAVAAEPPVITSLSATAGPLSGGRAVTITGSDFTRKTSVRFGSTPAAKVVYSSASKLVAVSPARSRGPVDVRVQTTSGTSPTAPHAVFTYRDVPTITQVSPDTGSTQGGTTVVIDGEHYTRSTKVRFGDAYATNVQKVSSTRLTAVTPAGTAGPVDVRVTSSGGTSETGQTSRFTYTGPPTLRSLSSHGGPTTGGSTITVLGSNFVVGSTVRFGEVASPTVKVLSPTQLTAVVPKHPLDRVDVTVATSMGRSAVTDEASYQYGTPSQLRLNVGSFNVRVGSGYYSSRGPGEQPWTRRVGVVVDQVKRESLDVLGVQEASASKKYTATGVPQFQDIVDRLGKPYKLTDADRYCYDADSAGRCSSGASSADRIIYNSDRVALIDHGARKLDKRAATDGSGRYVVWAVMQDKRTDKKFFFVNTHLEPNKDGNHAGRTRAAQAAIVLDEIERQNTKDLPTVFVGDLAASKFDTATPSNAAHGMLTDAGFVDPLVNTYKYRGQDLLDQAVNTRFNSLNYFEPAPRTVHESYAIGSYVDYILVRGGDFDLGSWHTVMNLDERGRFAGVIPSDHHLITLTVGLP